MSRDGGTHGPAARGAGRDRHTVVLEWPAPRRRLSLALAGLLASCAAQADLAGSQAGERPKHEPSAVLYYVSAMDCPYCHIWDQEYRAGFEASGLRARVRFVPLHVPTVRLGGLYEPAWPGSARWVRRALIAGGVTGALPLFVLARGDAVLDADQGLYDGEAFGWRPAFTASVWRAG